MKHDEINCLSHLPIFANLSTDELKEINRITSHRQFYKKGEIIDAPYLKPSIIEIDEGQAKVYTITDDGDERIVEILHQFDFNGENNLFLQNPTFDKYIEATEDSWVCKIDKRAFEQVILSIPELAQDLLSYFAHKASSLELKMVRMTSLPSKELVYCNLVDYAHNIKRQSFELPISKKTFAGLLNITPETLSRDLKELVEEHKIKVSGKVISIL